MRRKRRAQELVCWVVSDGKAGMESQCLGLAEILGVEPVLQRRSDPALWNLIADTTTMHKTFQLDPMVTPEHGIRRMIETGPF